MAVNGLSVQTVDLLQLITISNPSLESAIWKRFYKETAQTNKVCGIVHIESKLHEIGDWEDERRTLKLRSRPFLEKMLQTKRSDKNRRKTYRARKEKPSSCMQGIDESYAQDDQLWNGNETVISKRAWRGESGSIFSVNSDKSFQ